VKSNGWKRPSGSKIPEGRIRVQPFEGVVSMAEDFGYMGRESSAVTDSALVRNLLWEYFPEQRSVILTLEAEERDYAEPADGGPVEVGAYTLTSEVFVQGILTPLLQTASSLDEELAQRCAHFLERLLGSGRDSIHEMVSIRITDHLLGYPENWVKFQIYAGDLLHREVDERQPYYKG
jgi:hypothetical protein